MAAQEACKVDREERIRAINNMVDMTMQATMTDLHDMDLLKINIPLVLLLEGIHAAGLLLKCAVLHAKTSMTDAVLRLRTHTLKGHRIKLLHIHRIDRARHDRQCKPSI